MSYTRQAVVAQSWTICSVFVRTRDGPDRLDQTYRRLCHDGPFLLAAITAIRLENSHACCHLCRVSTERQERQQTITSQLATLQAWAEAAGRDLSERHVFRDEGYSGSRLDRPGLDALRDAVRDGEFDVVAVVSPDRLACKYA